MKDKVIVVGVDAIADALEAVKTARLDATVFQDAEGQGARPSKPRSRSSASSPSRRRRTSPFAW